MATMIDVRTPEEFATWHAPEAINLPYDTIADTIAGLALDKHDTIHLYCRSGNRSGIAAHILSQCGYTNCVNIGGLDEIRHWLAQQAR